MQGRARSKRGRIPDTSNWPEWSKQTSPVDLTEVPGRVNQTKTSRAPTQKPTRAIKAVASAIMSRKRLKIPKPQAPTFSAPLHHHVVHISVVTVDPLLHLSVHLFTIFPFSLNSRGTPVHLFPFSLHSRASALSVSLNLTFRALLINIVRDFEFTL